MKEPLKFVGMKKGLRDPSEDHPVESYTEEELKETRQKILSGDTLKMTIRWYTPQKYIDAAREVMGDIDVDPATDERVQKRIKAKIFYTVETNGLDKPWTGRVWLNPPYAEATFEKFPAKMREEYRLGNMTEGIMFCPCTDNTHKDWFQDLAETSSALCFIRGYVKWVTGHYVETLAMSQLGLNFDPEYVSHPQVVFYLGKNPLRFAEVFSRYGFVKVSHDQR